MKKERLFAFVFTMVFFLFGCSLPGLGKSVSNKGIVIAGGNMTERQIIAELVSQMIEHYMEDVDVSLINNLGSSTLIHQAMIHHNTNISAAMYTGTSLVGELGMKPITDPIKAYEAVVKGYDERFDEVWFPSYGFENTYAFMVSREFAKQKNLKTISDLKALKTSMKIGVDNSWMKREGDGYKAFKQIYGFEFDKIYTLEIGLVYKAVSEGQMDVVLGYTTDGRIDSYDLVILEDDLHLFPPYDASPVVTKAALEEFPQLEEVLLRLEGSISSSTMQRLNRMADEELVEPHVVAKEFLIDNNYFKAKKVIPLDERKKP